MFMIAKYPTFYFNSEEGGGGNFQRWIMTPSSPEEIKASNLVCLNFLTIIG